MIQLASVAVTTATGALRGHLLSGDSNCPQIAALLEGSRSNSSALNGGLRPLAAITALLRRRREQGEPIRTLHLIAHGRPGAFRFGDSWIDSDALKAHADELAQWGVETIALWSCHVGADAGFVALLEELSGARVLARADWLGRDGGVEQTQLGEWQLSDLVAPEAWPAQFRLEDFDDEIKGSDGNDQLVGTSASEQLIGRRGRDTLKGGRGKDTLDGGKGNDFLKGGQGSDVYRLSLGNDTIQGYKKGDKITPEQAASELDDAFWSQARENQIKEWKRDQNTNRNGEQKPRQLLKSNDELNRDIQRYLNTPTNTQQYLMPGTNAPPPLWRPSGTTIPDPAKAELVAAFRAKNYNTNDGFAAERTNTRPKGRAFYSVSICGALSVLRRLPTFSPFLRPSPICLAKFDRCFA